MIVLDTDVLIDFLRDEEVVVETIRDALERGETLGTTTVNVAEILRGLEASGSKERRSAFEELVEKMEIVPLGLPVARRYGKILASLDEAGQPIPGMDGLIAAATVTEGGWLFTRNTRHFDRVPGLQLLEAGEPSTG